MVSLHDIIIYVAFLLPISTLFVNQGISNKALFLISISALILIIIKRLSKRNVVLLLILMVEFLISIIITKTRFLYNFNDIFYLPQWALFCLYFSQYINRFDATVIKKNKLLKYCIFLWEILFVILRVIKPSMNEEFSHRTASSAFLIIIMVWYYSRIRNDKIFNLHMIVPLMAIFVLQVRTYLIAAMVVACMTYYSLFRKKFYFFITIIPVGIVMVFLVLQTAIGAKFTNFTESYYGGVLATITSSRSVFWAADIQAFIDSNWIYKFLGNGYNYIYEVNKKVVNTYIWGHNDIIHILVTNGIVGLFIYFYSISALIKKNISAIKVDKRLFIMAILILSFCALFDGLYHYTCALYTIPFIFAGLCGKRGEEL